MPAVLLVLFGPFCCSQASWMRSRLSAALPLLASRVRTLGVPASEIFSLSPYFLLWNRLGGLVLEFLVLSRNAFFARGPLMIRFVL